MTEIQRDSVTPAAVAERAKIYGPPQPKTPNEQKLQQQHQSGTEPFLPRVAMLNNGTTFNTGVTGAGGGSHEPLTKHQLSQVNLVLEQMDRLRALMREKEIDMLKLRHENMILKQIERRQQKEIEQLDVQSHDAPKIIRGLRDEISGLKNKIKSYYTQLNAEARRVRSLNDECLRLKDNVVRLEELTTSNELLDRETLTKKVAETSEKLAAQDNLLSEAHRKSEMVEKLLTNENRQLRGKIHNLTAENSFLKDKNQKSMDTIQEREKEIASLSIYRYNAVHKKTDQTVCKKCEQREKEQSELKRKQTIQDKIPPVPSPIVSILNGCSVQVVVAAPYSNPDSHIEYDKLTLKVTTDPNLTDSIREFSIPVKMAAEAVDDEDKNSFKAELSVNDLESGQYYHFLLVASSEGIDGQASAPVSLLVDELPQSPPKPAIAHSILPPIIQLFIEPFDNSQKASPPISYQIYHSNDPSMVESFLIGEVHVEHGKPLRYTYNNARVGITHYFRVAAVNTMGVGCFSDICDPILMDCPPNKPSKPHITKLDSKSIHILTFSEPNGGTDIETWKITSTRLGGESNTITNTQLVPASGIHHSLDYVLEGLEPGIPYIFNVSAISSGGESDISENSDEVNLDMMVPVPDPPTIEITSATAVTFSLPPDPALKYGDRPKLIQYRILGYHDMSSRTAVSVTCGIGETSFVLDGLDRGASYNFALALIGEDAGEGSPSDLVFVPLAAGIALPPSPESSGSELKGRQLSETLRDDPEAPNPAQLKKSKSRSLSLTQRSQNMHDGNPAYHDPEDATLLAVEAVDGRPSKKMTAKSSSNLKQGGGTQKDAHSKPPLPRKK
ncbi:ciliary protein causing Leber congenital amaurosis disease-domain-containing protein [Obelidium mucronatum]|nr:ciliary protein causing Leber congenital amaurosis disease-domain-containing protein [Obelidium mucronatum]